MFAIIRSGGKQYHVRPGDKIAVERLDAAEAAEVALSDGPFGLRQPAAHHPPLAPHVVLTPLVGFDRRGNRLGQGAGHYDRAFAAFPAARRIGIALDVQETDQLRPDPWDVPLHAIATNREWIVP